MRRHTSRFQFNMWLQASIAVGLILNSVANFPERAFAQKKVSPDQVSNWGAFLWTCMKARFPEISLSGDGRSAFDTDSKRNFARDGDTWIDVKTGEIICPQLRPGTTQQPARPPPNEHGSTIKLDPNSAKILDLHNKARAEVGSPPLQWDFGLAKDAKSFAQHLASGVPYAHAARAGRENARENLSMGRLGETPVQMMGSWLNEKDNFVPSIFPNVSKTGDWSKVGHYSQMVWATTTRVGCGTATGAQWEYLVCRYSPPGNQDGKPVLALIPGGLYPGFAVGPPKTGLDVNVCSGRGASGAGNGDRGATGAGNDVDLKASTNAVLDALFKCEDSVDTAVQPPALPKKEVFKPEKPDKFEDPM